MGVVGWCVGCAGATSPVSVSQLSLTPALYGNKRKFVVVEDGDRKGFQSTKGILGKTLSKISAMTLSPRSPCFMPLDYAFWQRIEQLMRACEPKGTESKAAYIARLRKCAKSLPKAYLKKQIGQMKNRLQAVIDAKGYNPKND